MTTKPDHITAKEFNDVRRERDELQAALNEVLAQNERFNTRYRDSEAEVERLRAAAMKLDDYWISDTYSPGSRNVTVRESAFAELRDLLGLKPKTYV